MRTISEEGLMVRLTLFMELIMLGQGGEIALSELREKFPLGRPIKRSTGQRHGDSVDTKLRWLLWELAQHGSIERTHAGGVVVLKPEEIQQKLDKLKTLYANQYGEWLRSGRWPGR